MGRLKKGYNWKARASADDQKDSQPVEQKEEVLVDFDTGKETYDSSNPLVLSSKLKKPKTKLKQNAAPAVKPLSKKKKKQLSKILEKKKKKATRVELLEQLQKVQASSDEIRMLTSTSVIHTGGLKRASLEPSAHSSEATAKISSIKGSRKKGMLPPKKRAKFDPNIVGFDDQSSSESESEESDEACEITVETEEPPKAPKNESVVGTPDQPQLEKTDPPLPDPEMETTDSEAPKACEPAVFVAVNRLPEIQAAREALPIYSEEQAIMEAIKENLVVIIHGETGSGKTTQIPQFLYEAGYTQNNKLIGITEPRRIAAITMAKRVGEELNMPESVSYHIRYEKTVDDNTKIKFMTDGVLLKEIRHDFLLTKYSVIIIDEAHERSVFSDVLIGLLSRIVPLREKRGTPLKLVIMSATIRVEDFLENPGLFKEKPFLIRIASRQYQVQVHFNIKTPPDYIEAAYEKVSKIHQQLPTGAILVFLTGEKEVTRLCKMLRKTFPYKETEIEDLNKGKSLENPEPLISHKRKKEKKIPKDDSFSAMVPKIDLDDYSVEPLDTDALQHQHSDDDDEENALNDDSAVASKLPSVVSPLYVLPLYSVLPSEEQEKVFKPPPPGTRLCVVSTNVAETSITIPGLKYVVDSGKVKNKVYNKCAGGISSFVIMWTSKASANQRAGRAGRTEGGHCYRLYSSAVFEHDFPDFSQPEIQRIPVDDVLLQMKALGIDRVVSFPFPTPPDREALKTAEKRLVLLGALQDLKKCEKYEDISKWEYSAKVTPLGQAMSRFPLSPRYSKMLLLSYKHNCIPYVVALVSAMTVPEVFLCCSAESADFDEDSEEAPKLWRGIQKIGAGKGQSLKLGDAMVFLRAVALYEEATNKVSFCVKNGIRHKAMVEIHKMRCQLIREMNRSFRDLCLPLDFKLNPPKDEEIQKLCKIVATGFTDHVARRIPDEEVKKDKLLKNGYKCLDLENPVFIHPSSILFKELPEFVAYQEINHTSKYYMRNITAIEPEWLPGFAPSLSTFGPPQDDPPPYYNKEKDKIFCNMTATFGTWQWELPCINFEMPSGLQKYNWFCFFLLDGQICSLFMDYKKYLLSRPSTILKSWAKLLPRTRYMLQAVIAKEVDSRGRLYEVWRKEPKYLLREFWEWLPEDKHMEVECKWPPKSDM